MIVSYWGYTIMIAILQDIFFVQMIQIYILFVIGIQLSRPQIRKIYNILRNINTKISSRPISGNDDIEGKVPSHKIDKMSSAIDVKKEYDSFHIVQHISGICRLARTKLLYNLKSSHILRSMTDDDYLLCQTHLKPETSHSSYLYAMIYFFLHIPGLIGQLTNEYFGRCMVHIWLYGITTAFFLANAYLYQSSPYYLVIPYSCIIILYGYIYFISSKTRYHRLKSSLSSSFTWRQVRLTQLRSLCNYSIHICSYIKYIVSVPYHHSSDRKAKRINQRNQWKELNKFIPPINKKKSSTKLLSILGTKRNKLKQQKLRFASYVTSSDDVGIMIPSAINHLRHRQGRTRLISPFFHSFLRTVSNLFDFHHHERDIYSYVSKASEEMVVLTPNETMSQASSSFLGNYNPWTYTSPLNPSIIPDYELNQLLQCNKLGGVIRIEDIQLNIYQNASQTNLSAMYQWNHITSSVTEALRRILMMLLCSTNRFYMSSNGTIHIIPSKALESIESSSKPAQKGKSNKSTILPHSATQAGRFMIHFDSMESIKDTYTSFNQFIREGSHLSRQISGESIGENPLAPPSVTLPSPRSKATSDDDIDDLNDMQARKSMKFIPKGIIDHSKYICNGCIGYSQSIHMIDVFDGYFPLEVYRQTLQSISQSFYPCGIAINQEELNEMKESLGVYVISLSNEAGLYYQDFVVWFVMILTSIVKLRCHQEESIEFITQKINLQHKDDFPVEGLRETRDIMRESNQEAFAETQGMINIESSRQTPEGPDRDTNRRFDGVINVEFPSGIDGVVSLESAPDSHQGIRQDVNQEAHPAGNLERDADATLLPDRKTLGESKLDVQKEKIEGDQSEIGKNSPNNSSSESFRVDKGFYRNDKELIRQSYSNSFRSMGMVSKSIKSIQKHGRDHDSLRLSNTIDSPSKYSMNDDFQSSIVDSIRLTSTLTQKDSMKGSGLQVDNSNEGVQFLGSKTKALMGSNRYNNSRMSSFRSDRSINSNIFTQDQRFSIIQQPKYQNFSIKQSPINIHCLNNDINPLKSHRKYNYCYQAIENVTIQTLRYHLLKLKSQSYQYQKIQQFKLEVKYLHQQIRVIINQLKSQEKLQAEISDVFFSCQDFSMILEQFLTQVNSKDISSSIGYR